MICQEHPTYLGVRKPRAECRACWEVYLNNKGLKAMIRETDDLALIQCPDCLGAGKRDTRLRLAKCPVCHGSGDIVVHHVRHYERRPRRPRKAPDQTRER